VITQTIDARGFDAEDRQAGERPNPMTGPFFVDGAKPGDSLKVRIDRMTPSRRTGWTYAPVATNVIDPTSVSRLPERQRLVWTLERQLMTAHLAEPPETLQGWTIPIKPMIGRLLGGVQARKGGAAERNDRLM
jgi:amidase